ncbi:MAG: aspartate/glutamate racemase family protein [Kouleothrix sp.]
MLGLGRRGDGARARLIEHTINKVELAPRCAAIECTSLSVLDTEELRDHACLVLEGAGRKAIAAGAEALALGCAGMSGLDTMLEGQARRPGDRLGRRRRKRWPGARGARQTHQQGQDLPAHRPKQRIKATPSICSRAAFRSEAVA